MPDDDAHDEAYRKLRETPGRTGWDDEQQQARDIELLQQVMAWPEFPTPPGRLLEIGCGAGNITLWFARLGWRVVGIDVSPTAIDWAREDAAHEDVDASFGVGDVASLGGVADRSIDVVLDGHCLHCITGADRALVLASAHRVLRPGGLLCVRTMCNELPAGSPVRSTYDPATRCVMRNGQPSRYIGLAVAILAEVRAAGFSIERAEVFPARDENDVDELIALARRDL